MKVAKKNLVEDSLLDSNIDKIIPPVAFNSSKTAEANPASNCGKTSDTKTTLSSNIISIKELNDLFFSAVRCVSDQQRSTGNQRVSGQQVLTDSLQAEDDAKYHLHSAFSDFRQYIYGLRRASPKTVLNHFTNICSHTLFRGVDLSLLQNSEEHLTTRFKHYEKYLLPQLRRYIKAISHSVRQDFLRPKKFFEFGVGEGVFSAEVFNVLMHDGWEGTACDLNDYVKDSAKRVFSRYIVGDGLGILGRTADSTYSVTFEMTVLHHLASVTDYLFALKELVRVTAPGGYIIIVETCHPDGNTATLLKNAVLDLVFNDIVNRAFDPSGETRMIPCPLSFLSDEEIINEIERHSARLVEITRIPTGHSVPKRHCSFLFQKKSTL